MRTEVHVPPPLIPTFTSLVAHEMESSARCLRVARDVAGMGGKAATVRARPRPSPERTGVRYINMFPSFDSDGISSVPFESAPRRE